MPWGGNQSTLFNDHDQSYDHTPYETDILYNDIDNLADEITWHNAYIEDHKLSIRPEIKLWTAVLIEAIENYHHPEKIPGENYRSMIRIKQEAHKWFLSNDDYPGSFLWICVMLDLDPAYWRDRILCLSYNRAEYDQTMDGFKRKYDKRVKR
jgi:hypothetical protein